jgi:ribosomal protein S18 acetylase RimI-like enzyme
LVPAIRSATVDDAASISHLLVQASEEFIVADFDTAGREHFLSQLSVAEIGARLSGGYRFYVAELPSGVLVGVAAVRLPHHLYYLFVARPHHRTGVARKLWSYVLADPQFHGHDLFTVNASNYAVLAYERLGFRRCGLQVNEQGVLFNPMEWRA